MVDEPGRPIEADIRRDDEEFNPQLEPKRARAWLNLLKESEEAFQSWNDHCDKIDKQYASLDKLSSMARDKEFQIFWANAEVIKPAIYARPPIPVVVPKFRDRRPLYQAASEVMERCCVVAFDLARINDVMLLVRDDLALAGRGVVWPRYESGARAGYYGSGERVCLDFKHRRDFLHSISRCWYEVSWVAGASYLTRGEARQRFGKTSGDEYQNAEYRVDKEAKDIGGADARERAKFWEIWDRTSSRVVWVAQGCEFILDEDDPHLDLQNFFPCPQPAYGTCQRGSLVPVPDVLQYRDQLEEINLLTGRIHALSDALEVKGFYPSGGAELAEGIQRAIAIKTPGVVMVPISNWAAFGGSKEVIIWLPIDQIATTIQTLVELRRQVIEDIYQITGMADIMRGDTDPNETLGAQQLKTQYGSSRIRDKQHELVRLSVDLVEITSEIVSEKFDPVTMIEMSQTQLPTQAMISQRIATMQQSVMAQLREAAASPQGQQMLQQNPQQAQQVMQMAQQQLAQQVQQLQQQVTIEQVLQFLQDNRARSFVLDIETDSTILADENAEKQRRGEFMQMLAPVLAQMGQLIAAEPGAATFCGDLLRFAVAPFRAGRSLDGSIDDFVQVIQQKAGQQKGDDPYTAQGKIQLQIEQMKLTYAKTRDDADRQLKQQQLQIQGSDKQARAQSDQARASAEIQGRASEHQAKLHEINARALAEQQDDNQDMREGQVRAAIEMAKLSVKQQEVQQRAAQAQQRVREGLFKMPKRGPGLV